MSHEEGVALAAFSQLPYVYRSAIYPQGMTSKYDLGGRLVETTFKRLLCYNDDVTEMFQYLHFACLLILLQVARGRHLPGERRQGELQLDRVGPAAC